jgi:Icc-related predicted phosphoesterase
MLRERLAKLRPALHCFGHVHASAGSVQRGGTLFANACMVDSRYRIARTPLKFEL